MRFRAFVSAVGLLLLLLATTGVKGCREEAARTFNPNRPPETYLTAAPVESTTTSYLYHVFWNGSDPDGEVVGYVIAVTDSNELPLPEDLVWTTRTDTSIAFKVAGTSQTLTHRFYCVAVDNEGRADPTPAWVFFEAFDRYYPEPMFLESYAVGTANGRRDTFWLDDEEARDGVRDTIPVGHQTSGGGWDTTEIVFRWTGRDRDRFGKVLGYRFRITGDAGFTDVDTTVTRMRYTNLPSGVMTFSLVAVDDAGAQTDPESTRVFVSNFDPDTWYDREFLEMRIRGPKDTLKLWHQEFDTVAVGALLEFTVHGKDPDGDDSKLQYSHTLVTNKWCGGGSIPAFSFFDKVNIGPTYKYRIRISDDPGQSGLHRAWARTKDELGRIDGTRAQFIFYSNLPPECLASDVLVGGKRLDLNDQFTVTDNLRVKVNKATDPDLGSGPGNEMLGISSRLEGMDVTYTDQTPREELGFFGVEFIHDGITESGRYKLTVAARDAGCVDGKVVKEIQITVM